MAKPRKSAKKSAASSARGRQKAQAAAARPPKAVLDRGSEVAEAAVADQAEAADSGNAILRVLIPHREVTLTDGRKVVVKPWPFEQTQLLLPRLASIYTAFVASRGDTGALANDLLLTAFEETKELIRESVVGGFKDSEFTSCTMEDGVELATAMVEVCLIREKGGGLLPKVAKLVAATNRLGDEDPSKATEKQ